MGSALAKMDFSGSQIQTIRRTIAKDANDNEFDLYMSMAEEYGLSPFKKLVHIIIYSKDKPDKRSHAIFPSRDGYRIMAARQGDYRPASGPASFVMDESAKDPERNPLGIISCGVTLHKQDPKTNEWNEVYGEAYWEEFAKIIEEWNWTDDPDNPGRRKRLPTGKFELSGGWKTMPRLMIQKCAEGQALRAGWPDVFGGTMSEDEVRKPHEFAMRDITPDVDLSPSEKAAKQNAHDRSNLLGKPGVLMVFDDTGVLERVEMGKVADQCASFIEASSPEEVYTWRVRNEHALREFWASEPGDALELKTLIEAKVQDFDPMAETEKEMAK